MPIPPLHPGDTAVTHLPGDVTVSTRRVARLPEDGGGHEHRTVILIPGTVVEVAASGDTTEAISRHLRAVDALLAGVDPTLLGLATPLDPEPEPLTRDEAITRLRDLAKMPSLNTYWKPWELAYAVGRACNSDSADVAELRRIAEALDVTIADLQRQPFGAAPSATPCADHPED